MRLVSPLPSLAGGLGTLLLAAGLWAGPQLHAWNLQQTQNQERVRIRWTEPAPIEINEFPAARQVVVTIPEAFMTSDLAPLDTSASTLLQSAKAQSINLADGREAVQVTFDLREWRDVHAVAGAGWLTLSYERPGSIEVHNASVSDAPSTRKVIKLSNADLEALDADQFGSSNTPATGAGQADAQSDAFAPFYVPPDLTPEEKAQQMGTQDLGMLTTMDILNRTVDLDFKDAELQNVIRLIASKLGLNIILTPDQVNGRVTLSLSNVQVGDALDALLKSRNLAYKIENGGIVRIVDRKLVQPEEKETIIQSVSLNWVDADEIMDALDPFMSDSGEVQSSEKANVIIIKDVPDRIATLQDLITRLDVPEKQVKMEVRLVDMSESASRNLGLRTTWTKQDFTTLVPVEEGELGTAVDLAKTFGGFGSSAGVDSFFIDHIADNVSIFGNDYILQMRLEAEENRGEAVTLANPTILSLNNTEASIEIKRQVPYRDAVNSTQGSVASIRFADLGTKITLTPRITNHGYVQMEIQPEQKILVGTDAATNVPIIDERFAETSVIVKDEQTVALGGLRQFDTTLNETGVPWLLRAPVISWLFKSQSSTQNRVELFLFVTPHIVKDPQPEVYEMGVYEKIDYNWDLPDYYYDEIRARKGPKEQIDPKIKY
ncbi:secretin and TonB N-terminal domain-containing protein [bacterium]|nr:secretin and TonB N-terminal domain-containing protein [bacterium]